MSSEQDKILEALQYALQMEIDGKAFYLKSAEESSNELGKKLFESLAEQEDYHRQKFEKIYENIKKSNDWPEVDFTADGGKTPRTIFAQETGKSAPSIDVKQTELDAVQTAITLEDKSYDFYRDHAEKAGPGAERDFFETIAAEEKEHKLILLDYYEFIQNPAAWHVNAEHPSLDG